MSNNLHQFIYCCLLLVSIQFCGFSQNIAIIPKPAQMTIHKGSFSLNPATKLIPISREGKALAQYITYDFGKTLGVKLQTARRAANNYIKLGVDKNLPTKAEGYRLKITPRGMDIIGKDQAGLFYGIQTLKQLLPPEIFAHEKQQVRWRVPCLEIQDEPRFKWRGMHLDPCRHFVSAEWTKKFIDLMAMHKLNTLHWHLTEDQAWRIEIKKYPKLTEIGAWRKGTGFGLKEHTTKYYNDKGQYGGFYTQEEIRDIVRYAAQRNITVVPEIELPGHAMAALVAYPQLSCTGGPFEIPLRAGVMPDVYCPGKESTFHFLQDVLVETMRLFPSEIIHIGGDECPKTRWESCPDCQKRIKDENLHNEHELQSYVIKRIEKFMNEHKRRIIGWDEILEGGLAPNAAVMFWRGVGGAAPIARKGHDVVLCPTSHCYFDYGQASQGEPRFMGGVITLEKAYSFEPMPGGLDETAQQHILGIQATLWSEFFPDEKHVEYMAAPRISALAEVAWSPKELKNWPDFSKRMNTQYKRMDFMDINYRKPRD